MHSFEETKEGENTSEESKDDSGETEAQTKVGKYLSLNSETKSESPVSKGKAGTGYKSKEETEYNRKTSPTEGEAGLLNAKFQPKWCGSVAADTTEGEANLLDAKFQPKLNGSVAAEQIAGGKTWIQGMEKEIVQFKRETLQPSKQSKNSVDSEESDFATFFPYTRWKEKDKENNDVKIAIGKIEVESVAQKLARIRNFAETGA